jgi:hypothetical protein
MVMIFEYSIHVSVGQKPQAGNMKAETATILFPYAHGKDFAAIPAADSIHCALQTTFPWRCNSAFEGATIWKDSPESSA